MTMTPEPIIRDETFRATPDEVFDAFTVPDQLTQWLAQHADVDAHVHGWWTFTWPPYRAAKGRYITVDRPHHLVWTWDESIQDTRVAPEAGESHPSLTLDSTLTSLPNGETHLHIEERGHADEASRTTNAEGIDQMLVQLREFLEDGKHIVWTATSLEKPES